MQQKPENAFLCCHQFSPAPAATHTQ
jgi:hypothetical protein